MTPRENWYLSENRIQEQEAYRPHREILFRHLTGHMGAKAAEHMISNMTIEQYEAMAPKLDIKPNTEVANSLKWVLENRTDHTELVFQSTSPRNQDPHKPISDQSVDNLSVTATGVPFKLLQELKEKAVAAAKEASRAAASFGLLAILAIARTTQQEPAQDLVPARPVVIVTDHTGELRPAIKLVNNTLDTDEQEVLREAIAALPPHKQPKPRKQPLGESFMDFFSGRG